ncbi:hypothetical protein J7E62_09400 [Variovorax paradoxus]|nr:hypothetical protein [Variovorax paradoxus]
MSAATIAKPAKGAKAKAPTARPLTADEMLRTVRDELHHADRKLEAAYDAAEPGSTVETMLRLIAHDLLPAAVRPICNDNPTKADAEASYEAMFAPLGALEATIALAAGTVLHHTLTEAFTALDSAHTALDICGALTRALPEQTPDERNFLRGRDLAILMLSQGHELDSTDEATAHRLHRNGKPQNRFARSYLDELMQEPALLDGFAAVLSADLSSGDISDAECWNLPMAEYEAGEIGADGTMVDDGEVAAVSLEAPARVVQRVEAAVDDAEARRLLAFEANFEISKLAEMVKKLTDGEEDRSVFHGIMSRIELMSEIVYFAMRLYSCSDEEEGPPTMEKLERAFKGMMP